MYTIRLGIFETNSSSSHSLTLCTEEEYQKFLKGELVINIVCGGLSTLKEALGKAYLDFVTEKGVIKDKKELSAELLNRGYLLHESWYNGDIVTEVLKTKNDEKVIGISIYGPY